MSTWHLHWTAFRIEYHWWIIRRLCRREATAAVSRRIRIHRYIAGQLSDLYEILCGIRDFDHSVIG